MRSREYKTCSGAESGLRAAKGQASGGKYPIKRSANAWHLTSDTRRKTGPWMPWQSTCHRSPTSSGTWPNELRWALFVPTHANYAAFGLSAPNFAPNVRLMLCSMCQRGRTTAESASSDSICFTFSTDQCWALRSAFELSTASTKDCSNHSRTAGEKGARASGAWPFRSALAARERAVRRVPVGAPTERSV